MISAEIPDKHADPFAYQSVCQYMIHGPCGYTNPGCACMVEGSCSKHYPKQYRNETSFDKNGFPIYRQRNNGLSTEKANGFVLDNGWVIPHNVDLVVKYQAHINVEICNRAWSVKYLFKYINNGHDRATVVIEDSANKECTLVREVDEVKTYLDGRYISASEASWRMFEFDVQYRTPSVERLMFHLPGEKTMYFVETEQLNDVQGRHNLCKTIFNQWLETNRICHTARQLTYVDFPTKWVWDKSMKEWRMMQKGECIGRVYYAHPMSGERFYMHMLLNIVHGPTCHEDIRIVNGVVFNTFKDACLERGLLDDDNEWDEALTEAAAWASPNCLREMFTTLMCFCEVSDAKKLWDKHWEKLSDDKEWRYVRRNGCGSRVMSSNMVRSEALLALEKIMLRNNRSLTEYWYIGEADLGSFQSVDNTLLYDEVDYDCEFLCTEAEESVPLLNSE